MRICPVCQGRQIVPGWLSDTDKTGYSSFPDPEKCRPCNGKGYIEAFDKDRIEDIYYNALNENTMRILEN